MGRKRTPFIDKKRATSYNLVFAASENAPDPDAPPAADGAGPSSAAPPTDRILVSSALGVGIGRPDTAAVAAAAAARPPPRYPPHHPLAWLNDEDNAAGGGPNSLAPARRREMLDLGFPDDGYDYLKHLREPAQARAVEMNEGEGGESSAAAAAAPAATPQPPSGPSVFLPAPSTAARPAPDVRAFDASALTIHRPARDDDDAAAAAGGVTALARAVQRVRQRAVAEVDALSHAEAALNELFEGAAATTTTITTDGVGDLQDDFVLLAAEAGATVECAEEEEEEGVEDGGGSGSEWCEDEEEEEADDRDTLPDLPASGAAPPSRRAGSIASTYWRPPRRDRPAALSEIDDAFEALALHYDSDEIGSLGSDGSGFTSDEGDDEKEEQTLPRRGDAGGVPQRDASAFAGVFASFLADHGPPGSGGRYVSPAEAAAAAAAAAAAEASGARLSVAEALDAVEGATAAAALAVTRAAVAAVRAAEGSEEEEGGAAPADAPPPPPSSSSSDDDDLWRDHPRRSAVAARAAAAAAAAEAHADPRWDCETVLSVATSTSSFRPGLLEDGGGGRRARRSRVPPPPSLPLDQIVLSSKTGLPLGTGRAGLPLAPRAPVVAAAAAGVEEGDASLVATPSRPPPPPLRRPGESPEERKARKAAVKAVRAGARASKKETKQLFKEAAGKAAALAAVPAPSVVHIP